MKERNYGCPFIDLNSPQNLAGCYQARLRGRLKTRMSPSNSVTVSELSLGIELEYDIVSAQQYYLAQKSIPIHKHCV